MRRMKNLIRGGLVAALVSISAGATIASADDKPLYGGTMVVGMASEPKTLNIALTTDLPVSVVTSNIYNKLLSLGPKEELYPELATSWEAAPDGMTYTFHLAENVKWHDGKPFSSADVKFSLENLTKAFHPQGAAMFSKVDSIEAPDDNTVVIHMNTTYEPFLGYLALRAYILPKHIYENGDIRENPANVKPIGTGPYKFVEWQRGSHITLEKNPDYFMKGMPYLDRFVYRIMPDPAARVLALETGEVDYMTHDVPSSAVPEMKTHDDIVVSGNGVGSLVSISQVMINHDDKPLSEVKVRQALSHAVDKPFIIERAAQGLFPVATGPINATTEWAYNPDETQYAHDPALAEKVLDEAGYPRGADGTRFKLEILTPRGRDDQVRAGEIVAQAFKEIGIDASVSVLDTAALSDKSYVKRDFQMMVNTLTTAPDPAIGVQRQYVTSNIRPVPFTNAAGYSNPEVDKLFAEAEAEPDRAKRGELYKKVQKILTDDAVLIWLWENQPISAWRTEFAGVHDWSTASPYYLWKAWWTKGKPAQ